MLSLIAVVDRLDGSTLGAMGLGCTTLGENTGRGGSSVGGLSGDCAGRHTLSSMWPFLLTLLDIFCEKGLCVASDLGSDVVKGKYGEAAACEKISLRCVRFASGDFCKHADILTSSAKARLPAAARTTLAGVTLGFEMYLCLCNTVADTLVARVFNIQNFHAR